MRVVQVKPLEGLCLSGEWKSLKVVIMCVEIVIPLTHQQADTLQRILSAAATTVAQPRPWCLHLMQIWHSCTLTSPPMHSTVVDPTIIFVLPQRAFWHSHEGCQYIAWQQASPVQATLMHCFQQQLREFFSEKDVLATVYLCHEDYFNGFCSTWNRFHLNNPHNTG
jgi:hypothetical protein